MTSEWTPGDQPPNDADWAWFADAYRTVPGPRPDVAAHAVQAATASLAKWHLVRIALKWLLGTATGVGIVVAGHSLMTSRATAPAPTRPSPSAPAPGRAPAAVPQPADSQATQAPKPAPTPKPSEPATTPAPTPAPSTPAAPTPSAPAPDAHPDTATSSDEPAPTDIFSSYGMGQPEIDRLRTALGEPKMREMAKLLQDAAQAGLPPVSLIERAMEGVSLNTPPAGIMEKVGHRFDALRDVRNTLGPDATENDLLSGADAIEVGAGTAEVEQVWRHATKGRAPAGLMTLTNLVGGGVPSQDAAHAVSRLLTADASDTVLYNFASEVSAEISRGVPALEALHAEVKSFLADTATTPEPGDSTPRPAP